LIADRLAHLAAWLAPAQPPAGFGHAAHPGAGPGDADGARATACFRRQERARLAAYAVALPLFAAALALALLLASWLPLALLPAALLLMVGADAVIDGWCPAGDGPCPEADGRP